MGPSAPQRKTRAPLPRMEGRIDHGSLDEFLGFQLRMAYIAASRHFASALGELDLTQKQLGVLWLIGANPGTSQIVLAKELDMDRASMMAIVDRLQMRGVAVRERSPQDGRRQELYLTAAGRKLLAKAKEAVSGHERWMTERFTKDELDALVQALQKFRD